MSALRAGGGLPPPAPYPNVSFGASMTASTLEPPRAGAERRGARARTRSGGSGSPTPRFATMTFAAAMVVLRAAARRRDLCCSSARCPLSGNSASASSSATPGARRRSSFGAAAAIYGTLVTSAIAMVIGVPVGLGIAVFLTELCPPPLAPADRHRDRTARRHPLDHLRHLGRLLFQPVHAGLSAAGAHRDARQRAPDRRICSAGRRSATAC